LELFFCPLLEEYSRAGESEAEFRLRLSLETREKRDAAVLELRADFQKKLDAAEAKILKAEERVEREKAQRGSAAVDGLMRVGTALLGAFMGRRKMGVTSMRRGTSAARGAGRAWKEHQEVELAKEKVEELEAAHQQLEQQLSVALNELRAQFQAANLPVEPYRVEPYKKDISVRKAGLLWRPRVLR
jgi:F0F1-type ATP synthase membrane subunit b/b'